jgi:ketosteroid isomerase-like protein
MAQGNVDVVRPLLPDPDTDVVSIFRDDSLFEAAAAALTGLFDSDFVAVAVWRGAGTTYTGVDGFREMWLDWLEPWAVYRVQVEEVIDSGDRVVVLVRDRARRADMDAEVELISGSVWTIRDGRVSRVEFYGTRPEALEAVGLAE